MVSCYMYITNNDIQVYLGVVWQWFDILVVLVYNIVTRGGGGGGLEVLVAPHWRGLHPRHTTTKMLNGVFMSAV